MTKEEVEEAKCSQKKYTIGAKECEDFGLELIDIKLEFGRIDGKIMVIDEISGIICVSGKTEDLLCKMNSAK